MAIIRGEAVQEFMQVKFFEHICVLWNALILIDREAGIRFRVGLMNLPNHFKGLSFQQK
ncbi:hypothetical protein J8TS2_28720 [Lederbergia ruris]|uniref:Uncharacterized protein n=1 Tax=Lederbergia ruris TaxID=217495 RepID=A0ABQ4KKS8_9BACI|nr:hypothetical protein J8TS2_28720 [Lederbergia ruris]